MPYAGNVPRGPGDGGAPGGQTWRGQSWGRSRERGLQRSSTGGGSGTSFHKVTSGTSLSTLQLLKVYCQRDSWTIWPRPQTTDHDPCLCLRPLFRTPTVMEEVQQETLQEVRHASLITQPPKQRRQWWVKEVFLCRLGRVQVLALVLIQRSHRLEVGLDWSTVELLLWTLRDRITD